MKTKKRGAHNNHKVPFSQQVMNVIGISDIVLEILDARLLEESRIPEMEQEVIEQGKILIHVINKADLLPSQEIPKMDGLSNPILISAKSRQGIGKLREKIRILASRFKNHAQVYVGVVGYPNTGKSSLLNLLARHAAAPVSSQPGFTKGIRKIRLAKGILLLDAPGVIPKNENLFAEEDRIKHGLMGVHTPENVKYPDLVVNQLMKLYPEKLEKYYGISDFGDVEILLEEVGKKFNVVKRGAEIDTDRVARRILKDWRIGKIR